jgi:hypothetical protein
MATLALLFSGFETLSPEQVRQIHAFIRAGPRKAR